MDFKMSPSLDILQLTHIYPTNGFMFAFIKAYQVFLNIVNSIQIANT